MERLQTEERIGRDRAHKGQNIPRLFAEVDFDKSGESVNICASLAVIDDYMVHNLVIVFKWGLKSLSISILQPSMTGLNFVLS